MTNCGLTLGVHIKKRFCFHTGKYSTGIFQSYLSYMMCPVSGFKLNVRYINDSFSIRQGDLSNQDIHIDVFSFLMVTCYPSVK